MRRGYSPRSPSRSTTNCAQSPTSRCWPTSCSDIAQVAGGGNVLFERDNAGCLGA